MGLLRLLSPLRPRIRPQFNFYYDVERNELYNAHGAVTDTPTILRLVSPCRIDDMNIWTEDGSIFAELGME